MDNEEKIQEINNKFNRLEEKIEDQGKLIENLKNNPISRFIDEQSRARLKEIISEQVIDIVWDEYYYFSSTFDSIDRYSVTGTAASETINSNGLYIETNGTGSNEGTVYLPVSSNLLSVEREARCRIINKVSSETDVNWSGLTLVDSAGTSYVGFEMNSGSILGVTSKAGSKTSVTIGSYSANTNVKLELHFSPERVTFFVDDEEQGVSTSNIPIADPERILEIGIGETSSSARSCTTSSFDFIQSKK